MTQDNKLFQDMIKMTTSAFASLANIKNDMTALIKQQIEVFMKNMQFVTREEFEVVKKMAAQNQMAIQELTGSKPKPTAVKKDAPIKAKATTTKKKPAPKSPKVASTK